MNPSIAPRQEETEPNQQLDTNRLAYHLAALTNKQHQFQHTFLAFCINFVNAAGGVLSVTQGAGIEVTEELLSRQALAWSPSLREEIEQDARKAMHIQRVVYQPLKNNEKVWIISAPYPQSSRQSGCLSLLVLLGSEPVGPFVLTSQLLASLLAFHAPTPNADANHHALLELILLTNSTLTKKGQQEALLSLNTHLKNWTGCSQVAIGLVGSGTKIQLHSLSDVTTIDRRTEHVRLMEEALAESTLQQTPVSWPQQVAGCAKSNAPVFEKISLATGNTAGIAMPLLDEHNTVNGSLICLWEDQIKEADKLSLLPKISPILSQALFFHRKNSLSSGKTTPQSGKIHFLSHRGLVIALSLVGLLAILFFPLPYYLKAEGVAQPVTTRYVVARFEGILKTVSVKPGNAVTKNATLATLDGKEIEIQLANLAAEKNKAKKMREQYMAVGNTAAVQIARLDEQRYQEHLNLLHEKQRHLQLTSPVTGIVLSGDLERSKGSPVSKGQTLFAVAPLEQINIELAVQEDDIASLKKGMGVSIRFAAYPDKKWRGKVEHIVPQSQIRDNKNIFIADFTLKNNQEQLRPGMRGTARLKVGNKSLAWQLFRRPWYTLLRMFDRFIG
ncbi:efflux RND transporter periplasmic adaptor subunit [Desulfogranum marinum]|uniref:efflux RND transporter periplasmic adaptor subunit n=1 Tax=Desulfogranum marinum TaxID=453220 RepID=UPI0029C6A669|nr:efflux RND transporter periplasmic adaptor subunit [Desulfogranum marinum]